jgi:hypothetical protein
MITPSFGITATERVLPKLALDFTTASLDPRVTFTRSGNTATVVNSSGNLTNVNADIPRFDYDASTLLCKGLLIEESRTNTITNNTMVGTVAGTPGTNPNAWGYLVAGTGLTKTIVGTGTENGINYIDVSISGTAGATVAITAALEGLTITASNGQTWANSVYFRLISGSLSNVQLQLGIIEFTAAGGFVSGANYSITSPTNASLITQRFSATRTLVGGATVARVQPTINSSCSIGASINFTLRIGLPQMELGAFPTSVILTSSATVTRNADIATMTGTNFSDWYTATTGAAVVWAIPQSATGIRPLIQFDDTTALEIIALRGNVADPELYIVDILAQAQIDVGTIVANTAYKLSGAWNTDSCAAAQNGAAAVTDNTATIPTPTQLRIGSDGTNYASALIQKILYYPQRIINAEVQAISK